MKEFSGENSTFEVVRRGYFWCQGETQQAHLWGGENWTWNSPGIMQADEYYQRFTQIHENLMQDMQVEGLKEKEHGMVKLKNVGEVLFQALLLDLL